MNTRQKELSDTRSFYNREFKSLRFGDRRLEERFLKTIQSFALRPKLYINRACESWAQAKGAYRLFDHHRFTVEAMMDAHRDQLVRRALGLEKVVVVQDTTLLNFTKNRKVQGMGSIDMGQAGGASSQGMFAHVGLALSLKGVPLGIVDERIWSRARLDEEDELWESEQNRWRTCVEFATDLACRAKVKTITVCDREADWWQLMEKIASSDQCFVMRAKNFRISSIYSRGSECSLDEIVRREGANWGEHSIEIDARVNPGKTGKLIDRGPSRKITVSLNIYSLQLDPEKHAFFRNKTKKNSSLRKAPVHLVLAHGTHSETGETILWILKTNLPVHSLKDALEVIRLYEMRWLIELYFKVLKNGCTVEKSRLEDADRTERYVGMMTIVAWRIFQMAYWARFSVQDSCESIFTKTQWKALFLYIHRGSRKPPPLPKEPPDIRTVVRWLAGLGGFLGRKNDGEPGVMSIWRGWEVFQGIWIGYELASGGAPEDGNHAMMR